MFLDIKKIGSEPAAFDREFSLPPLAFDGGVQAPVADLRVRGTAERGPDGVDFRASIAACIELPCSRCLEPVPVSVEGAFRLLVVPGPLQHRPGETEISERDAALFAAEEGKVDFAAVAREQLYLLLPLKTVCRADCKGLCATCGADRNRIECGCHQENIDPRFAPLMAFKRGQSGS